MKQFILIRPYFLGIISTFKKTTMSELKLRNKHYNFGTLEIIVGDDRRMRRMGRMLEAEFDTGHFLVSPNLTSFGSGTKEYIAAYDTLWMLADRCETLIAVMSHADILSLGKILAENHLEYFGGVPPIAAGQAALITPHLSRTLLPSNTELKIVKAG